MADKNTIKNWFKTGLKPTQAQFWATWDSFWHKDEKIPITAIEDIENILNAKAEEEVLTDHLTTPTAHADLFNTKEDKTNKGAANGYVPLNSFIKISSQYLAIVDDLLTGGSTSLLSAEQGKVLKTQIDAINTLLSSNDVNLDTVQELVNAIKTVQTSLSTILVNDLTTGGTAKALTAEMGKSLKALYDSLSTNKVDKVAGERLINAAEITKLSGLVNVTTTVKPILSTVLATQDIAGFVSYLNALTPVLVVGANEIVEYKTTDTGRVFKLLLRGRSFGVGQPAIVAADVIENTEFLNKDIKLSNYPSTRNDGQLPTNKVLAPDVNGNIKLYTIATAPPPYLDKLIPGSYLPSNTGNFILKGSFFTPNMTVVLQGQTINYKTFISDNEVRVNVTTGSAEGYFDVILNNGISATFSKALFIVLGTVFKPNVSTWTNKTINADTSEEGSLNVGVYGSQDSAIWNQVFDITKNFRFSFNALLTPFSSVQRNSSAWVILKDLSGNEKYRIDVHDVYFYFYENGSTSYWDQWSSYGQNIELRWVSGVLYFYVNGAIRYTSPLVFTENLKLTAIVKYYDLKNIRYVELAN